MKPKAHAERRGRNSRARNASVLTLLPPGTAPQIPANRPISLARALGERAYIRQGIERLSTEPHEKRKAA